MSIELLNPATEEELAEDKQARKQKRLDDCGSWATWFDPHTGRHTGFTFYCDLWRECPTCLDRRAKREKKFIEETIQSKNVVMIELDPDETRKLTRNLDKDEYQRFPQNNGLDLVFIDRKSIKKPDILSESVEVTARVIDELDWNEIVNIPGRKNKSGALFTSTKISAKENDWAIVEITQFVSEAPREIVNQVANEVVGKTKEMNPKNVDEVVDFIQQRVWMTIESLQNRGYECTTYMKKVKVSMTKVDWQCQNLCLINRKNNNGNNTNAPNIAI